MPRRTGIPFTLFTAPLIVAAFVLFACRTANSQSGQLSPSPTPLSAPRLDDWRILGPGGGGAMFNALPSPHDKSTLLVSTDMTGCFVSHDGGESWRLFYLRWTCNFAFDPRNPDVFYAAANQNGLYRSQDRGQTWQLLFPDPKAVQHLYSHDDEAEQMLEGKADSRNGIFPAVSAVAVHPEDPSTLFIAAGTELRKSGDGGKSWRIEEKIVPVVRRIWIDPRPGIRNRKIILQGVNRAGAVDGRFEEFTFPAKVTRILGGAAVFPASADNPVIYFAVDGVFQEQRRRGVLLSSRDMGKTWQECWQPLAALGVTDAPPPIIRAIGASPANPNVLYLSYGGLTRQAGQPKSFGVARSDDSGKSFRLVWEETEKAASNIEDPWLSDVYGPDWGENPLQMTVHPKDPDFVLTTDYGRTMKTIDGGKTWRGLYSRRLSPERWTTTGLDVNNCYGVHFDPFFKGRVLASCTDLGLLRSEDRGSSWTSSWKGVPREWRNTMYWTQFDRDVPGMVWGAASKYHDLPRARTFRDFKPENFKGGMVVSRDSGKTWSSLSEGLPNVPFTHFIVDWKSPKDRRTIWAAAMSKGVYRSQDGGRNWEHKSAGIDSTEPNAWRLHLDSGGRLYLVVARRTPRSEPGTPSIGGLYRSDDRGESWLQMPLPAGVNGPTDLYTDPQNPDRILLTAWPKFDPAAPPARISGGGLFLSTDRGKTWRELLPGYQHMYSISGDPSHPERLYAIGFTSAIFRSDDRGETWRRLRGFNFRLGHRVFPDPFDAAKIYVATMGGGIWYGPAEGSAATAVEDITAPPVLRFDAKR